MLSTPKDRAAALILVLAIAIAIALAPFLSGLLGAAVLYVVFVGPYKRLEGVMKPGIASTLVLVAALAVIALPAAWLIGLVIEQAPDALQRIQHSDQLTKLAQMRIGKFQVGIEIAKASGTIVSWLSSHLVAFAGGATSAVLNLVIAFFGLYYMLRSGTEIWTTARGYIPFSPRTADALRDRFFGVTQATLLGTAVIAIAQGTLIGGAFAIVGLPNPLFWGVVTAFASVLPVLGSGLVWLPATLMLIAQGRNGAAVVMVVIGAGIASNIDNVVRPLVYRRVSNIHPMITLVGAFAGVRWFGLLGVLLGPLAIAYLFELLRFYREDYSKGVEAPPGAYPSSVPAPADAPAV